MMLVAAQRRSNDVDSSRSLSALSVARAPVASYAQRQQTVRTQMPA
jgi:hypothetical protein